MKYRGLFIDITEASDIEREDKDGNTVVCSGYYYRIYADENKENLIDDFCAAVGYELPDSSIENASLFAREFLDSEYKGYLRERDKQDLCSPTM